MPFSSQVNDSLNFLTQSIQSCTNVAIIIENSIRSSRVNCTYMVSNQNKFVLPDLSITVSLSKCEKVLCFLYKGKKVSHGSFYEYKWFLNSSASAHCTPFESNFVNITLGNYD